MRRQFLNRWGHAYNDLLSDIEKTVAALDARDAASLRQIIYRLGQTNCWFAIYALRGAVLSALDRRARNARKRKRKDA